MNSFEHRPPVPVAIIGMGCMFPRAEDLPRYWANIRDRVDAITDVPESHWRAEDYHDQDPKARDRTYSRRGGFLSPVDFPPLDFGIAPHSIEATDTTQLLGLLIAKQALEDAGYPAERQFDRDRVSVILGISGTLELVIPLSARLGQPVWRRALRESGVEGPVAEAVVERIASSYVGWQENSFPGLLGNVAAGRIANRLDLRGTNCVVDAACASSLGALEMALLELSTGRSDMAVTGGIDTFNDIFVYMCFSKTPALSPSGEARPFDASADGTILGEGLGMVVLKRLDDARRDGDRIYAVIRSIGTSSDGKGQAVYAPSAAGQVKALRRAYDLCGIAPESVELVEAHGTGTKVGDATELQALEEVFGSAGAAPWCALGSVKSQIGHTKAAAGSAGLIKAALALHHKVLPPTTKVERPIERLAEGRSPFYLNTEPRPWLSDPGRPRRAAVSAFGFGGSNFHCVLEEAEPENAAVDWDGDVQILAYSADQKAGLLAQLDALEGLVEWSEIRAEGSRSRQAFDGPLGWRVALVARRDETDWNAALAAARERVQSDRASGGLSGSLPSPASKPGEKTAVFCGRQAPGKLAFLFPGQGSQYVGMLRDLACRFPQMRRALALANELGEAGDVSLSSRIYPRSAFRDQDRLEQEQALRETQSAQPAIGAVSLGLLAILEDFGVRPELAGGHSFGELTALRAAGRFDDRSLALLAARRGQLMRASGAGEEAGAMLAVLAPIENVRVVLEENALELVIANKNAPRQCVVSGPVAAIKRSESIFAACGMATRPIGVSRAFHSRLVSGAEDSFRSVLDAIDFAPSQVPVFANTTALPYPADASTARAILAGQLARPVEFVAQIEAMYRMGARTFLEVGPDSKLCSLVRAILEGQDHRAIAVDQSRGSTGNVYDLACTLASLAALGHGIDLTRWDSLWRPANSKKPGLTVKVCGANPRPKAVPEKMNLHQSNGQSHAHELTRLIGVEKRGPSPAPAMPSEPPSPLKAQPDPPARTSPPAQVSVPAAMTVALQNARESLIALERLSEQTASLHRQFLEGQAKTQQAFMKLLEHEQQLSWAMLGSPVATAHAPLEPARVVSPTREESPVLKEVAARPMIAVANGDGRKTPPPRVAAAPATVAPIVQAAAPPLSAIVIEVVSEKTGYPADVLDLDMQLDADLGIDSIKRVEILSALQDRIPSLPAIAPELLGTLRTLRAIVEQVSGAQTSGVVPIPSANGEAHRAEPDLRASEELARILLETVADKTGYPAEMLELDMRLDADLGIDSIKRVEIFSALQERMPDARTAGPEEIGTLGTLREIVSFLSKSADVESKPASQPRATGVSDVAGFGNAPNGEHVNVAANEVVLRTLVPRATALDGPERREPVDLRSGAAVWITDDGRALAAAIERRLTERGYTAKVIGLDATLPAPPERLGGLIVLAPRDAADHSLIKKAFQIMRAAGPALQESAADGGAAFLTVSRLDGCFGLGGLSGSVSPISGGLAGLAKTAAREWPGVNCKAIDVDAAFDADDGAARVIVDELHKRGPDEVGISRQGRIKVELETHRAPATLERRGRDLVARDVVVISGGGRGITAEVAVALASACGPRIVVLGRSPAPGTEEDWLASARDDAGVKRALAARSGRKLTPQELAAESRRILAEREVRCNLERIVTAGSQVSYFSVDVRDAAAVQASIAKVRRELGPIRGLVHGAGVLADRKIVDQTDAQFDLVYGTKAEGLDHLWAAIDPDALSLLVLFSSSSARFGRLGQVAYAAANEYLNKWAQQQAVLLAGCRVVSFNWGPWAGGMVTDALKPMFKQEGVALIPLGAGAKIVVEEARQGGGRAVEIVVAAEPARAVAEAHASSPAASLTTNREELQTVFQRVVDLESVPVLSSHVIDGHAVLPVAMTLEWMAEAAIHRNPGLLVCGLDEFRLFKGVILSHQKPARVDLRAGKPVRRAEHFMVPVELCGTLANGRDVVHARSVIVLGDRFLESRPRLREPVLSPYPLLREEIYQSVLFHGPLLQGIESVEGCGEQGIAGWVSTVPIASDWLDRPVRSKWLIDPLAIDSAFQLVGLWTRETVGANSLPTGLGSLRIYRREFPDAGARVVVEITHSGPSRATAAIEILDEEGRLVARLDDFECVIDGALNQAFRRNRLSTQFSVVSS